MPSTVLKAIAEKIDIGKVGEFDSLHTQIKKMSTPNLIEFFKLVQSKLPRTRHSKSRFSYSANSELSGFPVGNPSFTNRAEKLKQACYFAAIYADQLVLIDPFSGILKNIDSREIDPEFVLEFSFFLSILIMMDPLLENGIITFSNAEGELYCADCFYELIRESDKGFEGIDFIRNSDKLLLNEAQVRLLEINNENRTYRVRIEGPSDLIGDQPYELEVLKQGRILTKKDIGNLISPRKLKHLGVLYSYSAYSFRDIATKENISTNFGINRNFASSAEISLLKRTFGENQLLSSSFESNAPILMANSLQDLISMRENEWHHFENFRNTLHTITDDIGSGTVEGVYRDTLISEMIKIERIIEKSRRVSGREIIKGSGVAVFAITSSVMTAGLSTLISAAAGVLGGGHFVKEMIPALHDYLKVPEEAKDSQYYYAWKLKNFRE
jgi:hypothetical protein